MWSMDRLVEYRMDLIFLVLLFYGSVRDLIFISEKEKKGKK